MFCENCGNQLSDGAKFCTNCGCQVNGSVENAQQNQQNQQAAPDFAYTQMNQPPAPDFAYTQGMMNVQMNQPVPQNTSYSYNQDLKSAKNLGTASIILAFLFSLAGLICGIIGCSKAKSLLNSYPNDLEAKSAKEKNTIGIILSVVIWALSFFIYASLLSY